MSTPPPPRKSPTTALAALLFALCLTSIGGCGRTPIDRGLAPAAGAPPSQLSLSLNGPWTCADPGCAGVDAGSPVTLRKVLKLPSSWSPSASAVLVVDGIDGRISGRINETRLESYSGGLWSAQLDLGVALKPGDNELELQITPSSGGDACPAGPTVTPWIGDSGPSPDLARIVGDVRLELGGKVRIEQLSVRLEHGRLEATARTTAPKGRFVQFMVVRDNYLLARFPPARVDGLGMASSSVTWSAPLWRSGGDTEPSLQYLVATIGEEAARQMRFGAREVRASTGRIAVNGQDLYLAAMRAPTSGDHMRQTAVELSYELGRRGANALELRGDLRSDELLSAADELGIMTVFTPECTGPGREVVAGQAAHDWNDFQQATNRTAASWLKGHPSIILWNSQARFRYAYPNLLSFLPDVGIAAVDDLVNTGDMLADGGIRQHRPPAFTEAVAATDGHRERMSLKALEQLLADHRRWGAGIVLPDLKVLDDLPLKQQKARRAGLGQISGETLAMFTRWDPAEAMAGVLTEAGIDAHRTGVRRGPAMVSVVMRRGEVPAANEPVLLTVPRQPTIGAFTDAQGRARFQLDFNGAAEVSSLDGPARVAVQLRPGVYRDERWFPSVSEVVLDLNAPDAKPPATDQARPPAVPARLPKKTGT